MGTAEYNKGSRDEEQREVRGKRKRDKEKQKPFLFIRKLLTNGNFTPPY